MCPLCDVTDITDIVQELKLPFPLFAFVSTVSAVQSLPYIRLVSLL